jgi:hypothetical protein
MSQLEVESMMFEFCEEFNKLNPRTIANTERSTRRQEDPSEEAQYQGREVDLIYRR